MNTNNRVGKSLGVVGTSIAVLFGSPVLAVPAYADTPTESASAAATRVARTDWHFDAVPIRSALQLLAEEGGFNLVVSDTVTGTVSLRMKDVTWEQVLTIVLRMKGLEQTVVGNSRSFDFRG